MAITYRSSNNYTLLSYYNKIIRNLETVSTYRHIKNKYFL